jgi:hypothetical protein
LKPLGPGPPSRRTGFLLQPEMLPARSGRCPVHLDASPASRWGAGAPGLGCAHLCTRLACVRTFACDCPQIPAAVGNRIGPKGPESLRFGLPPPLSPHLRGAGSSVVPYPIIPWLVWPGFGCNRNQADARCPLPSVCQCVAPPKGKEDAVILDSKESSMRPAGAAHARVAAGRAIGLAPLKCHVRSARDRCSGGLHELL